MTRTEPATTVPVRPRRRRRRWRVALGAIVLLFVGIVEAHRFYGRHRLTSALAEADRLDPGWRLDQLEARRAAVADAQNGARLVTEIALDLPPSWYDPRTSIGGYLSQGPRWPYDAKQAAEHHNILATVPEVAQWARELAERPIGRYPGTPRDRCPQKIKEARARRSWIVQDLLKLIAIVRAEDGDGDAALDAVRGLLNVARSFGDEPTPQAQFHRMMDGMTAARYVECVLSHCEPSEAALLRTQAAFQAELDMPLLLTALRALRAERFAESEWMRTGELHPSEVFHGTPVPILFAEPGGPPGWFYGWLKDGAYRDNQAALIEATNRLVEAAKAPDPERRRAFAAVGASFPRSAWYHLVSRHRLASRAFSTAQAVARVDDSRRIIEDCAVVSLAAERYRRTQGHLPESLDVLVPTFLASLPRTPYGDGRLRLARPDGAWVVYSVDEKGTDTEGLLYSDSAGVGNVGLRLRDVSDRPKPAAPVSR